MYRSTNLMKKREIPSVFRMSPREALLWEQIERAQQRWMSRINAADWRVRGSVMLAIGLINIGCGAVIYKIVSPPERSWSTCFFRVYAVLLDVPNATVMDDGWAGALVLNLLYLVRWSLCVPCN